MAGCFGGALGCHLVNLSTCQRAPLAPPLPAVERDRAAVIERSSGVSRQVAADYSTEGEGDGYEVVYSTVQTCPRAGTPSEGLKEAI